MFIIETVMAKHNAVSGYTVLLGITSQAVQNINLVVYILLYLLLYKTITVDFMVVKSTNVP